MQKADPTPGYSASGIRRFDARDEVVASASLCFTKAGYRSFRTLCSTQFLDSRNRLSNPGKIVPVTYLRSLFKDLDMWAGSGIGEAVVTDV